MATPHQLRHRREQLEAQIRELACEKLKLLLLATWNDALEREYQLAVRERDEVILEQVALELMSGDG